MKELSRSTRAVSGGRSYEEVVANNIPNKTDKITVDKNARKNKLSRILQAEALKGDLKWWVAMLGKLTLLTKSQGFRVQLQLDVEKSIHAVSKSGGDDLSVVPGSLSISKGNQRKVSVEKSGSNGKTSAGAFMEEETAIIKRREEEDFLANANSPVMQIRDSRTVVWPGNKGVGANEPTCPGTKNLNGGDFQMGRLGANRPKIARPKIAN
ncbi:hypothetical protein Ancab_033591 [Ancistrocladus abbreviatus]